MHVLDCCNILLYLATCTHHFHFHSIKILKTDLEFVFVFIEWPRSIHEDHNVAVKDAIADSVQPLPHFVGFSSGGFICVECGNASKNVTKLAEHYKQEHSSVAFCVPCCKAFKSTGGFNYHQRMHQGGLSCETCGKIVQSESHLKRHMLTHTTEKSFPCPLCGRMYKHKFHMSGHLKTCMKLNHST